MNRHERRRAANAARQTWQLASVEILDNRDLIRRAMRVPWLGDTIARFRIVTGGSSPPMCAACPEHIAYAPCLWVIFESGGSAALSGVCDGCAGRTPDDLAREIVALVGGMVLDPANFSWQRGVA